MPRRPSANALTEPLSCTGSTLSSTSVSFWKSVFTSSCTAEAATLAPLRSVCPDGTGGGMNSTDLAPKMVFPAMCTAAFDGICWRAALSIARDSLA
nr:hypothetical protein CPGR_02268 [Mycolicibacter nonchromogenicus]